MTKRLKVYTACFHEDVPNHRFTYDHEFLAASLGEARALALDHEKRTGDELRGLRSGRSKVLAQHVDD